MRQSGFERDRIHGKAANLPLLSKQANDSGTDRLDAGFGHTVGIPEKAVDRVCAYRHK
jgi:hypothetical protein